MHSHLRPVNRKGNLFFWQKHKTSISLPILYVFKKTLEITLQQLLCSKNPNLKAIQSTLRHFFIKNTVISWVRVVQTEGHLMLSWATNSSRKLTETGHQPLSKANFPPYWIKVVMHVILILIDYWQIMTSNTSESHTAILVV